jgi:hypothetical protein
MHDRRFPVSGWSWVILAGLVAGTLDIFFATGFWAMKGVPALRILQSVAAGVLGAGARESGLAGAALGLFLHYLIATGMAAVFVLASQRWPAILQRAVAAGLAYGLLLYAAMRFVVVPLSAVPAPQAANADAVWVSASIVAHMLLVGLPIALISRRGFLARPFA